MSDLSNNLIAVEDIVRKLTADDMTALASRVTAGPKGEPGAGFGVEIYAKSTGLPVTETLATFWSRAVAEGLEGKWGDNKVERCPLHRTKRRYLAINPWACTCGFVFWHNLGVHASFARANELNAETKVLVEETHRQADELGDIVKAMRGELATERVRLAAEKDGELAALITEIGAGGWPYREAS